MQASGKLRRKKQIAKKRVRGPDKSKGYNERKKTQTRFEEKKDWDDLQEQICREGQIKRLQRRKRKE